MRQRYVSTTQLVLFGNSELLTYSIRQFFVYIGVSRKGCFHFCFQVDVNVVFFAVVQKYTFICFQMVDKYFSFHSMAIFF